MPQVQRLWSYSIKAIYHRPASEPPPPPSLQLRWHWSRVLKYIQHVPRRKEEEIPAETEAFDCLLIGWARNWSTAGKYLPSTPFAATEVLPMLVKSWTHNCRGTACLHGTRYGDRTALQYGQEWRAQPSFVPLRRSGQGSVWVPSCTSCTCKQPPKMFI